MLSKLFYLSVISFFLLACGGNDNNNSNPNTPDNNDSNISDGIEPIVPDDNDPNIPDDSGPVVPDNNDVFEPDNRTLLNETLTGNGPAGNGQTWQSVLDAGLTVRTFEQTLNGETVSRRFLQYLPNTFDAEQTYPLVILLHGFGINAEITRQFDTEADLESLADENEFVVVYGNALAFNQTQPEDDPFFANSGGWVRSTLGTPQTLLDLDLDYLIQVEAELARQGILIDPDARFISGISNGGEMTFLAADRLAPRYKAAYAGIPVAINPTNTSIDMSMMIYYSINDPLLNMIFTNYATDMENTYEQWARAIGIDANQIENVTFTKLPDNVNEGSTYNGNSPIALATRNSRLEQASFISADGENRFLLIRSENAGHGIAHPLQFDRLTVENSNGFRNEDLNSIERMWEFFNSTIQ